MPYTKSPRPYDHEYDMQKKRGELPDRMERQRARRKVCLLYTSPSPRD